MKPWLRRILIASGLFAVGTVVVFESCTRVGRGWWDGEPFYEGRPVSYWANEIQCWETKNPAWEQTYERRSAWPRWAKRMLHEPSWPRLLDGDPEGLAVLRALAKHPAADVADWARIGIDRIDNDERGPFKLKHPDVILTASLHEVDQAFYEELSKEKWRSSAELEKLERLFLEGRDPNPVGESLLDRLNKQTLLLANKETKIELRKEGTLLARTRQVKLLPSPAQLRKGNSGPQMIDEGIRLSAHVDISADRRHVRVKFSEKITEIEGIDKVSVLLDNTGQYALAEVASVKEATFVTMRNLPEGATFLLPLQYRPADATKTQRWLVVRIAARFRIEAEERQLRGEK